jgi:hypothetical protein
MWKFITLLGIVIIIILAIYNVKSLIRKWKASPQHWFDLLVGILMWIGGIAGLIYIFFQQL